MSKVNLDLMPLDLRSHLVFIKDQIEWCEGCVIDRDENDNPICIRDYCNLDTAKYWLDMFIELEKDLGCPLEVLSSKSAMVEKDGEIYEVNIMAVSFTKGNIYFGSELSFTTRKIKDYGKTWWLKEDKSE